MENHMTPLITTILATLFILVGGIAILIMLEMTGGVREQDEKAGWLTLHKIFGYFFIVLFAFMLAVMMNKTAGILEELSVRAVFHITLALVLIPLLVIKVLIARRYPKLKAKLSMLGITIFTLSFGLTGITAGYYALHHSNLTYTTLSANDTDVLDLELGKAVVIGKCNKCHSLERVYRAYKRDDAWVKTVNQMAQLDSPNITSFDVKQILNFLIWQQKKRQLESAVNLKTEIGKTLVTSKCAVCHNLDRVLGAEKNKQEWAATVTRMIETMDDPGFLSEQEQFDIISFLSERKNKKIER